MLAAPLRAADNVKPFFVNQFNGVFVYGVVPVFVDVFVPHEVFAAADIDVMFAALAPQSGRKIFIN